MATSAGTADGYTIGYYLINNRLPPQRRHFTVDVRVPRAVVDEIVEQGYTVLPDLFPEHVLDTMRAAVNRIAAAENDQPGFEVLANNGHYIRDLLDKDDVFQEILQHPTPLSIARAVLGPQVWFGVEARIAFPRIVGQLVPWHIHMRVVPRPMPPFFCYPHAIHGLLYLDDVETATGPICILPGSHRMVDLDLPDDASDVPGQLALPVRAGTTLLMHCNLWHRTLPSTEDAGVRRVVLFGYTPAWIKGDVARGVKPQTHRSDELRRTGDAELRELLGEFYW